MRRSSLALIAVSAVALLTPGGPVASAARLGISAPSYFRAETARTTYISFIWGGSTGKQAGFVLRRALGRTPPASRTDGKLIIRRRTGVESAVDSTVRRGTRYAYALWVFDAAGHYSSRATTHVVSAGTDRVGFGNVAVTSHARSVDFDWYYYPDTDYAGVLVRRRPGIAWWADPAVGTRIGDFAAPQSSARDEGLTPCTRYTYHFFPHDAAQRYADPTFVNVPVKTASVAGRGSGRVVGIGSDEYFLLGNCGGGASQTRPSPAHRLAGVTQLSFGEMTVLAVRADGTVWGWGINGEFAALGVGHKYGPDTYWVPGSSSLYAGYDHPVQIPRLSNVRSVTASRFAGYAVRTDGTVWAWGRGDFGELGNGALTGSVAPVRVPGLTDVRSVASTGETVFAVRRDDTVVGWGENNDNALGLGYSSTRGPCYCRKRPVEIPGLHDIRAVSVGAGGAFALKRDGTVWHWGLDEAGKPLQPAPFAGLTNIRAISSGSLSTYFLHRDGTVSGIGYVFYSGYEAAPVAIPNLTDVTSVSGGGFGYALRGDGTVWTWKSSPGDPVPTPAYQVPGLSDVQTIASGYNNLIVTK